MSGGIQGGAPQAQTADPSLSPMQMLAQYRADPMANQSMPQMPQVPQWTPQSTPWNGGIVGGPAPGAQPHAGGMLGMLQTVNSPAFRTGILNLKRRM